MIPRKPLAPNNRSIGKLMKQFKASGALYGSPRSNESPSIFVHARAGRQNSEGFGGGNRIHKN